MLTVRKVQFMGLHIDPSTIFPFSPLRNSYILPPLNAYIYSYNFFAFILAFLYVFFPVYFNLSSSFLFKFFSLFLVFVFRPPPPQKKRNKDSWYPRKGGVFPVYTLVHYFQYMHWYICQFVLYIFVLIFNISNSVFLFIAVSKYL